MSLHDEDASFSYKTYTDLHNSLTPTNEGHSSFENSIQSVREMIRQREKLNKSVNTSSTKKIMQSPTDNESPEESVTDVKDKVKSMVQQFESKICQSLSSKLNGIDFTSNSDCNIGHQYSLCFTTPLFQSKEETMANCSQESMTFKTPNNLEKYPVNTSHNEYESQFDTKKSIDWNVSNPDLGFCTFTKYVKQDNPTASTRYSLINHQTFNEWMPFSNQTKDITMSTPVPGLIITNSNVNTTIVQLYPENLNSSVSEMKESFHKLLEHTRTETKNDECNGNKTVHDEMADSFQLFQLDNQFNCAVSETSTHREFSDASYIVPVKTQEQHTNFNQSATQTAEIQTKSEEEILKRSSVDNLITAFSYGQDADAKRVPTLSDYFSLDVSPISPEHNPSKNVHKNCISSKWIVTELNCICPELQIDYDPNEKSAILKLMKAFDDLKRLVSSLKDDGKNTAELFEENKTEMKIIWKHMKELQAKYSRLHSQSIKDNLKLVELSDRDSQMEQMKAILIKRINHLQDNSHTSDMTLFQLVNTLLKVELQATEKKFLKQIKDIKHRHYLQKMNGSIRNVHYMHYQDTQDSFNKSSENEKQRQIKHLTEEIMNLEDVIETKNSKLMQIVREKSQLEDDLKMAHQKIYQLEKINKLSKMSVSQQMYKQNKFQKETVLWKGNCY
ncbi:uncharacterized protein LOC106882196 [Octopus bimaculoides]|uniref:Uncharacterized protein n=1 Tax=Octopus bimaculoides TaxID=37653 RepID=A0A0L8FPD9_OCTBM|nr:uncharacterized protein LOC106882196 [Octopus bimaculoides]|eukprot:XP_014788272.1 PREDICTED: uncharacterized protein LOC106882196 [Octopus bimaculoides]